jgi:hypothetical protein
MLRRDFFLPEPTLVGAQHRWKLDAVVTRATIPEPITARQ